MKNKPKKQTFSELNEAEKVVVMQMLQEQNLLLKENNLRLTKQLQNLKAKLNKDSSNSHKPPSSDMNKKSKKTNNQKKTSSLKEKSNKKPGGQTGHKGATLPVYGDPDEVIRYEVHECHNCGNDLSKVKGVIDIRQEFEIPEPRIFIREHQAESRYCKCCKHTTIASFPENITHKTQYGKFAKSLMVYMTQHQFIPYDRASQFFEAIYGHKISPGTIVNAVNHLGKRLSVLESEIKEFLIKAKVAHTDETSLSVNGKKHWLHTVGTNQVAHFGLHTKRGKQASQDIGILPEFKGTLVHDHWKSYYVYKNILHALCNAHHLRELKFLHEQHRMKWAYKMSELLIQINKHRDKLIKSGKNSFSRRTTSIYNTKYKDILLYAKREQSRRGTIDSKNLINRLLVNKDDVLLFMNDFEVPFTNNLSEQDLRMNKIKQKVSGCFRSLNLAEEFCKIRSLLVSCRKNKKNPFEMLYLAFSKTLSLNQLLAA